jgi:UDP-glucose 4-epimerase
VKVLVTGGAGYIGSHTAQKLLDADYEVVALDNLTNGYTHLLSPHVEFINGDTRDVGLLTQIFKDKKIEAVIHFAALKNVSESILNPIEYYDNNYVGSLRLIEQTCRQQVPYFIFSSTAAVYKDPGKNLVNEKSPVAPITPYGKSKLMVEDLLLDLPKLNSISLRYFNVAGACSQGQRGEVNLAPSTLIKIVSECAVGKRDSLQIHGTDFDTIDGTGVRDYIHVEDLADLHVESLKHLQKGGKSQTLNCGYSSGYSVREVIKTMEDVCGKKLKVIESPRRKGDLAQVVADTSLIQKTFGWKPRFNSLHEICKSSYNWELQLLKGF